MKETNHGPVRFVNCAFWGPAEHVARSFGQGLTGFSSCTFSSWNSKTYAIEARGGSVLVDACEFQLDGPQLFIGSDVRRAIMTSCMLTGDQRVNIEETAKPRTTSVHIANNAVEEKDVGVEIL